MSSFGPLDDADFNQTPPFGDSDLFALDTPLRDAVRHSGGDPVALHRFGSAWGRAASFDLGRLANDNPPRLRTTDSTGRRIDRVEFHPAYHDLMTMSMADGLHCSSYDGSEPAATSTLRAARVYMASGVEAGHMCPITMTNAAVGSLRAAPDLLAQLMPKLTSRRYDARPMPWWDKHSVTIGMGMTERQGGTDVRANISTATAAGEHVEITGHKWFMSAPMCDAFLVLAQAPAGLSCYFLPRHRPDGSANALRFNRLKDKLGNRSNASSEVEFLGAYALPVGAPGAGVRTIIEMVQATRLDCAVASAGLMRMGLAHALHHVRHRRVFQRHLIDQPAMRAVLADMALDVEAFTALAFRLARAFDASATDPAEAAFARVMTPAIKYLVCKRTPAFIYEAMECHGGNGYVEELPMARLYREAPLNAIWEGSGNVMALDLLRAAARQPDATATTIAALAKAAAPVWDATAHVAEIDRLFRSGDNERHARRLCEMLAKLAALAVLADTGSAFARLYASTRLQGPHHDQYGATDIPFRHQSSLLARAYTVEDD